MKSSRLKKSERSTSQSIINFVGQRIRHPVKSGRRNYIDKHGRIEPMHWKVKELSNRMKRRPTNVVTEMEIN